MRHFPPETVNPAQTGASVRDYIHREEIWSSHSSTEQETLVNKRTVDHVLNGDSEESICGSQQDPWGPVHAVRSLWPGGDGSLQVQDETRRRQRNCYSRGIKAARWRNITDEREQNWILILLEATEEKWIMGCDFCLYGMKTGRRPEEILGVFLFLSCFLDLFHSFVLIQCFLIWPFSMDTFLMIFLL